MRTAKIVAVTFGAALWFASLSGCRPASQDRGHNEVAEESQRTLPPAPADPGDAPALFPENVSAFPPRPEPVEKLASIEQRYLAVADPESRMELIGQVSYADSAEAVDLLGRLFQNERDPDLQLALLAAVMVQEEQPAEQLAVFASGLWPLQPQSVRFIAVNGVAALHTPAAIQMLQGLRFDADLEIRNAAAEALER